MSAGAAESSHLPYKKIGAVYALSIPLAWLLVPVGLSWDTSVAGLAVGLGWMMGLAPWWLAINAVFVPALSWGLTLDASPVWPLAALVTLVLFYGRIWKNRVPLFFSSARSQEALEKLLPQRAIRFVDLGCGDARVLSRLARARPDSHFDGVEQAIVPWLTAKLRCALSQGDSSVSRRDLWSLDLSAYDVVYAYLSPAVMPRLWAKAKKEMRSGSLLVSAFAVPGSPPDHSVAVDDAVRTRLNVWRMGARK